MALRQQLKLRETPRGTSQSISSDLGKSESSTAEWAREVVFYLRALTKRVEDLENALNALGDGESSPVLVTTSTDVEPEPTPTPVTSAMVIFETPKYVDEWTGQTSDVKIPLSKYGVISTAKYVYMGLSVGGKGLRSSFILSPVTTDGVSSGPDSSPAPKIFPITGNANDNNYDKMGTGSVWLPVGAESGSPIVHFRNSGGAGEPYGSGIRLVVFGYAL